MPDIHTQLMNDLQGILKKQIELAQRGNIGEVEVLTNQANSLVERIAHSGILKMAAFEHRREQLQKLYDTLHLTVAAQKAGTADMLSRVRKGRKVLGAYAATFNRKIQANNLS
jgi:hypothetical protein